MAGGGTHFPIQGLTQKGLRSPLTGDRAEVILRDGQAVTVSKRKVALETLSLQETELLCAQPRTGAPALSGELVCSPSMRLRRTVQPSAVGSCLPPPQQLNSPVFIPDRMAKGTESSCSLLPGFKVKTIRGKQGRSPSFLKLLQSLGGTRRPEAVIEQLAFKLGVKISEKSSVREASLG